MAIVVYLRLKGNRYSAFLLVTILTRFSFCLRRGAGMKPNVT